MTSLFNIRPLSVSRPRFYVGTPSRDCLLLTTSPRCRMHFDFGQTFFLGSLALAGQVARTGGMKKSFSERQNIWH